MEQRVQNVPVHLRRHVVDVRLDHHGAVLLHLSGHHADVHPQEVRDLLQSPRARAVSHAFGSEERHISDARGKCRQNGCAGGRDQFGPDLRSFRRDPAGQLHNSRHRHREPPVSRARESRAHPQCGRVHLLHTQQLQAENRSEHVHDRVERPHLVKVDPVRSRTVHLRLCVRETREDGLPLRLRRVRYVGLLDDLHNIGQVPMRVFVSGDYVHLRPHDAVLLHLLGLQPEPGNLQLCQLLPQRLDTQPGIHQRAQDHVPADTGETIEICNDHIFVPR